MKAIVIGVSALLLSGCAGIPPAVTIATTAMDGVSWVVSGKTVTDHMISEVAGEDCRLAGIIEDGRICEARREYEPARMATLRPLPDTNTRVAARRDGDDPAVLPARLAYLPAALEDQGGVTTAGNRLAPGHAGHFAVVRSAQGGAVRRGRRDAFVQQPYLAAGIPAPRHFIGSRS